MLSDEQILARLLYKLLNNRCFVKGHMLIERIVSSVPKNERGRAKELLKESIKLGFVRLYGKTNYGDAYQLSIEKLTEITEFIKKHYAERMI